MNVRPATSIDAEKGCQVLHRSIVELCHEDHGGDPVVIAAWLANKTPEHWRAWLARPEASLYVAEMGGEIVGVGMVDHAGMILLNYVAPNVRYKGVSSALLKAMEEASIKRGVVMCTLQSTRTAERFYVARGYEPTGGNGVITFAKRLT